MKPFIHDDFLLESDVARGALPPRARATCPIVDYHCHLPVEQIAPRPPLPLASPRSGWRATTTSGGPCARTACAERFCTGDASDWEKFEAWARTVPRHPAQPALPLDAHGAAAALRHRRAPLAPTTARADLRPLQRAAARSPASPPRACCAQFKVAVVCTTDDPADSLEHHAALARRDGSGHARLPDLAPRPGARRRRPARPSNAWVARLEAAAGQRRSRAGLRSWTRSTRRHAAFHEAGCRASDHGLEQPYAEPCADAEVAASFDTRAARAGAPSGARPCRYSSALLHRLALMDHARGWVQQFHLGALRNNNTRLRRKLGADSRLRLHRRLRDGAAAGPLPGPPGRRRTSWPRPILYNLNPRDNELFATMIGNFQDGSVPGQDAVRRRLVVPGPEGRAWRRSSARSRTSASSRASSAWSRTRAASSPTRATSTSAGCSATCWATTSARAPPGRPRPARPPGGGRLLLQRTAVPGRRGGLARARNRAAARLAGSGRTAV